MRKLSGYPQLETQEPSRPQPEFQVNISNVYENEGKKKKEFSCFQDLIQNETNEKNSQ